MTDTSPTSRPRDIAHQIEKAALRGRLGDAVELDPIARDHAVALLVRLSELPADVGQLEAAALRGVLGDAVELDPVARDHAIVFADPAV